VSIQEPEHCAGAVDNLDCSMIEVPFDDDVMLLSQAVFREVIVAELARQLTAAIGVDPVGGGNLFGDRELAVIRCELHGDPGVRAVLDDLWRRGSLAHLAGCRDDVSRR